MTIHLRPLLPTAFPRRLCTGRATYPQTRAGSPRTPARTRRPFLVLLRVGFAVPPQSPATRWSLAPPFHPCPIARAVCFLWHCPAGHPGWMLSTTLPCGVRTFLSAVAPRSSGRLVGQKSTCRRRRVITRCPGRPVAGWSRPAQLSPDFSVRTRMRPHSSQCRTSSAGAEAKRRSSATSISRPQPPQRRAFSSAAPVLPERAWIRS